MPHTNNPMLNGSHQADLLFLPEDKGYKYALVVVDIATGKTDIEPLKTKQSKEVLDAMKRIYKRKYLTLQPFLYLIRDDFFPGTHFSTGNFFLLFFGTANNSIG